MKTTAQILLVVRTIAQIEYVICASLVIRQAESRPPSKPKQQPTYDIFYYIKQSRKYIYCHTSSYSGTLIKDRLIQKPNTSQTVLLFLRLQHPKEAETDDNPFSQKTIR